MQIFLFKKTSEARSHLTQYLEKNANKQNQAIKFSLFDIATVWPFNFILINLNSTKRHVQNVNTLITLKNLFWISSVTEQHVDVNLMLNVTY